MISRIKNTNIRFKLMKKFIDLEIERCGVDQDGDAFIQLKSGTIFFGKKTFKKRDFLIYKFLNGGIKSKIDKECLQVACDIIIRYKEGALKYGGPKKQLYYSVKQNDYVAEMGAYQGYCSLKLAEQVGGQGKVICIEPNRENFRLLKKNKEANKYDQMILVNKGVWDAKMELTFNMREDDGQSSSIEMNYSNSGNKYKIEANTLDAIFDDINIVPSDFMIIQLNGAEINGLRGLTKCKPKHISIAARYDTENEDAALAIKRHLEEKNYSITIVDEDYIFASLNS